MKTGPTNATIVLLGSFPPDAFLPDSLADAKVVTQREAKLARLRVLIPGVTVQFGLPWAEMMVSRERFQIGTTDAPYVRASDFAIKALHDLPGDFVVTSFGINVESHFDLGSVQARDAFGRKLAPPQVWGAWGKVIEESMAKEDRSHGGMMLLQMRKPFAEEKVAGWLDVNVGPSQRISNTGVFFRTNHHHEHALLEGEEDEQEKARQRSANPLALLDTLAERFDGSIALVENIFRDLLEMESQ